MRNNGEISLQDSGILRSGQNFSAGTVHFQIKWRYEKSARQCLDSRIVLSSSVLPCKCIQLTGRDQYIFTKREMIGQIGYAAFAMSAIASSAQVAASTSANRNSQRSSSSRRPSSTGVVFSHVSLPGKWHMVVISNMRFENMQIFFTIEKVISARE